MVEDDHNQRPSLGLVLPLANESGTVRQLLEAILVYLNDYDRIYCVTDGASKDNTRALIQMAADDDSRICGVWSPENRCVVDAYFSGYRAAFDAGHSWILEMDGGFSHDPAQIPQFLDGLHAGHAFVGGSRFMPGGAHHGPWSRQFISWGGSRLASRVLRCPMTDMTSGYEAFTRDALQIILDRGVRSRANFFQTEIRYQMSRLNWTEIPIIYRNNQPSVGGETIWESFRVLYALYRESQRK